MFDREDYEDLRERKRGKTNGHSQNLEYLVQAQVKMELLTGDPHWDRFLSYLQSSSDAMHEILSGLEKRICDPGLVDPAQIMEAKMSIARMMGRIETMDAVIGLPKDIIESGEKAKERLGDLEKGFS